MKYKALMFDLDGTLLDTIEDIADSLNAVFASYNYPIFSIEDYKYFAGRGIDELIYSSFSKGKIDIKEFDKIKAGYIEEYGKRQYTKTRIFLGIMDLINKLKEIGISVNILSNKPDFQTQEVVNYYFKNFRFDYVYGKKSNFKIKPNPESALDIVSKLQITPSEVLYVGDTNTDIQTAINAGFKSVGVLWGFRKKIELVESGADYIVDDPKQIWSIVVGEGDDFKSK